MQNENEVMSLEDAYTRMFTEFGDIVSVKEACRMLNAGPKKIRALVHNGTLIAFRNKGFQITKLSIVRYTLNQQRESAVTAV